MLTAYSGVASEYFYWSLTVLNTSEYLALAAYYLYMDCFPIYHLSCVSLEHPFSVPKLSPGISSDVRSTDHSTLCISFLSF